MTELVCKICGDPRKIGRKLCTKCNSKRCSTYGKHTWTKTCVACNQEYEAWRKAQLLCKSCYTCMINIKGDKLATNNYVNLNSPGLTEHRGLAKEILGDDLLDSDVVHHEDENPKNNDPSNFLVSSRSDHVKLHKHLDFQRLIFEKMNDVDVRPTWDSKIVPITNSWIQSTGVPVMRLSEEDKRRNYMVGYLEEDSDILVMEFLD